MNVNVLLGTAQNPVRQVNDSTFLTFLQKSKKSTKKVKKVFGRFPDVPGTKELGE